MIVMPPLHIPILYWFFCCWLLSLNHNGYYLMLIVVWILVVIHIPPFRKKCFALLLWCDRLRARQLVVNTNRRNRGWLFLFLLLLIVGLTVLLLLHSLLWLIVGSTISPIDRFDKNTVFVSLHWFCLIYRDHGIDLNSIKRWCIAGW